MTSDQHLTNVVEPKTLAAETLDGLGRGDVEAFVRHLAEDATWELVGQDYLPAGPLFVGREAILRDLVAMAAELYDLDSFDVNLKHLIADGPVVAAEFTLAARTPSGKDYQSDYVTVFTTAAGKVTSVREYTNTLYAKSIHASD
ncbi:MAG: nuclear transport factor 2 family protein [Nocardioides sp.]|uniref:nuclear transport factor 2 family protein n=1 Tax=Nocardioides sp. TaxID=35761 RepID=UPI0039E394E2